MARKRNWRYLTLGEDGEELYTPITTPTPEPETPAAVGTTQQMSETKSPDYLKPFSYGAAPAWNGSAWDDKYKTAVDAALGMNYTDWTQGADYAALAERYAKQGQRAVQDVLGQYAARTGGVASSYAVSAAQQQYNQYMQQLEEVARQMYANERGEKLDAVGMLQGLAESDYNRYQDELSRYSTDRNFAYDAYVNDRNFQYDAYVNDRNFDYGREMDALDAENAATNDARSRVEMFFAAGKTADDIPPELKAAAGYSDAELEAMESYYGPGGLTERDAAELAGMFGDNRNLSPEDWETALGIVEDFGGSEDWLLDNQFYRDPGVMANTDYADAMEALEGSDKADGLLTLAEWQNSPFATQFASYQEYIQAYLEYAGVNKKN